LVRRLSNRKMAGRFSICFYNFLESRSTLGEPQLGDTSHVSNAEPARRQGRNIIKIRHTRELRGRSEQYAGVYEIDCSNCKCRGRSNSIKRSDSILVCRFQPAAWCVPGLAGSMVCGLAQRVTRSRHSRRCDKS